MRTRLKCIVSVICAAGIIQSAASAANIGVCTHMTAKHTGETPERITELAKELGTDWIRDELRWGWGMQTAVNGEFKMPTGDWTDIIENAGINSLLILGYGNSIYNREGIEDEGEEYIPTAEHTDYFNAWKEYVKFIAQSCRGKVDAYEVWNEPNHAPFNYQLSKNKYSYSASDYAELLIATREVLDIYDPDAKVIGGAMLIGGTVTSGWAEELFRTLKNHGGADKYMDGFSFHIYSYGQENKEEHLRESLDRMEGVMDDYGYTGEAWLTETGYYTGTDENSVTDDEYASLTIRNKIIWDDYLKDNKRKGNYFWYVLRSTGRNQDMAGENFGLASYGYNPGDGFYSVKAYNTILRDMEMTGLTVSGDGNDYVAVYEKPNIEITDKVYIAYKKGNYSQTIQLPLSGDAAYVYDYMGKLLRKAEASGGSITLELSDTLPVFVHCIDYSSEIRDIEYDAYKNICRITGEAEYLDEVTIELIKDNSVVQTVKASVNADGSFEKQFQPAEDGDYIIRVGKNEIEKLSGSVWAEKETALYRMSEREESIGLTCLSEKEADGLRVNITGSTGGGLSDELLNILVLPQGSSDIKEAAYVGDVRTKDNGEFGISFKISAKSPHTNHYTLYVRGAGTELKQDSIDYILGDGDIIVYDFELTLSDGTYTASSYVKNTTDATKKPVIFIAQYDENNTLIQIVKKEAEADDTSKPLTVSVQKNSSATKCRAYIWEGINVMEPIAPAIEKSTE